MDRRPGRGHADLGDRCAADRLGQLRGHVSDAVRGPGLGQHRNGPRVERVERQGASLCCQGGDDHHGHGLGGHELAKEGDAVHAGHLDVEGDDVGLQLHDEVPRGERVRRHTNDFDVRLGLELAGENPPDKSRIIHDEHADGPRAK